jgi:hypothetical protein
MQRIVLLINPDHTSKARLLLQKFNAGFFVVPTVFRIDIQKEEIQAAVNAFEYILNDIDFHFVPLRKIENKAENLEWIQRDY